MHTRSLATIAAMGVLSLFAKAYAADIDNDERTVAKLDTAYQLAVERNDWQTMDRILHPDFVLVLGDGKAYDREHLIGLARRGEVDFEKQVEIEGTQKVRLFDGNTATVTALLWLKGKRKVSGAAFDYRLWFTDTYVKGETGWKYAFGQASLPLESEPSSSK